jgi:hypothetical protein
MNQTFFTVEEENLICAFNVCSRRSLIKDISAAMPDLNDPELREIAGNALSKLFMLSEPEFTELIFSPAYYNDESEV